MSRAAGDLIGNHTVLRNQAVAWLGTRDFQEVCDMAELNAESMLKEFVGIVEANEAERLYRVRVLRRLLQPNHFQLD